MTKVTIGLLSLALALAVLTHAREIEFADGVGDIDVPQSKLSWGNFQTFNFWIPSPTPPRTEWPAITTTPAMVACWPQFHGMPAAAVTGPCGCGTTTPLVTCTAGQICITTYNGVGTLGACTSVSAIPACPATAGLIVPCTCPSAEFPPVQNMCITPGMTSCVANMCSP